MSPIRNLARLPEVERAFSRKALRQVCEASEDSFGDAYDMQVVHVPDQRAPHNFYYYKDNGSSVLAVAHLESGLSTAAYFDPPKGKEYDYMIEFDRGGTDVVMYQYEDAEVRQLVKNAGARVGEGSFSDISYLGHLEIKGFNWGVGYQDYHGPRAHAYLDDTFAMVARYLTFAEQNEGVFMPHYYTDEDEIDQRPWSSRMYEWDTEVSDRDVQAWGERLWQTDDEPDWREYPSLTEIDRSLSA
jgi:hypothetical protein